MNTVKIKRFFEKLHQGKKTYLSLAAMAVVEYLYVAGKIDAEARKVLLEVAGLAGATALTAKFNRIGDALKAANNSYRGK